MHTPVGSSPPALVLSPPVVVTASLFMMIGMALVSLAWLHRTVATNASESPNSRAHIERVLELEANHRQLLWRQSLGGIPSLHHQDLDQLVAYCRDYERALAKVDLTGCPPAFRTAFAKHRTVWGDAHLALSSLRQCSDRSIADTNRAIHQITAPLGPSWAAVEDAAQHHGVLVDSASEPQD